MIAIVDMISPAMQHDYQQRLDLDNLPTQPITTPDSYHQLEVFKVQGGMNPMQLNDEYHFRFHNVLTGEQARQKISIQKNGVTKYIGVRLQLSGVASGSPFANGGNDSVESIVSLLEKRLSLTQKLMDLFVMGYVEKNEYFKIRALFESSNAEDQQLAKAIVEKQHENHMKF